MTFLDNPTLRASGSPQKYTGDDGNPYEQWTPDGWEATCQRTGPGTIHPISRDLSLVPRGPHNDLTIETQSRSSRTLLAQPDVNLTPGAYALRAVFEVNLRPVNTTQPQWWSTLQWRFVLWLPALQELGWSSTPDWSGEREHVTYLYTAEPKTLTVGAEWWSMWGNVVGEGEPTGIVLKRIELVSVPESLPDRWFNLQTMQYELARSAPPAPTPTPTPSPSPSPTPTPAPSERTLRITVEIGDNLASVLNRLIDRVWPMT